jgi:protein-S-isoprenylcysteine O-methyltransferase Ste14
VVIQDDHRVVEQGPYAWLRHPSYAGALVALAGIGLAAGDWVAAGVMLAGPLAVFLVRIAVEERALRDALGERYANYAARTRRLLPGLW